MPEQDELDVLAAALEQMAHGPQPHTNDDLVPPGERSCPICGQPMEVFSYEDVTLDGCPDHGVWLDRGELKLLYQRIEMQQGSHDKLAARQARRQIASQTRDRMMVAASRVALGLR